MIEEELFEVTFTFKDNSTKMIEMSSSNVDTMFDKLYKRDPIMWLDIWSDIVNLNDVRFIHYKEVEEEYDEECNEEYDENIIDWVVRTFGANK